MNAPGWDPAGHELGASFLARARAAFGGFTGLRGSRRTPGPSAAAGTPGAGGGRWRGAGTAARAQEWSGSAADARDPQPLDAALSRLVDEHGWTTDLAVSGVMARWDSTVGPDLAAHCRPERYADGELTVRADSTAWATQVRMLAATLVRRLNEELGDGTVVRVHVLGPAGPRWTRGPRRVRGRGPRDTFG